MRLVISLLLIGCATTPRFEDRPVVWRVADTEDVPVQPKEQEYLRTSYMANVFLLRRAARTLELRRQRPARSTNAWDEVPDSTWFTNRIGIRDLSLEELTKGPIDGPDPVPPLTVIAGKSGGGNPGFIAKDTTGRKFLVKFDKKENPEMQTATDVIVSRIFWALGYNVPKERVFFLCRSDVEIGEGAKVKNELKKKLPFTEETLNGIFSLVPAEEDGCYRALASEILEGAPIGGSVAEGVRSDDPNDRIPHEHRRELRGLSVFAAWLNHTDMKEDNTLDMYQEEGGRRFVRHYLLDFGEAFGGHAAEKGRYEDGYEHFWDWQRQPLALVSFGLWVRPWEHLYETKWPAIGSFTHEHFDPKKWREAYPYWPFMEADAADRYWAAKMVMRFSREMLAAIVAEGELSDPEAARYLTEVLYQRARIIGLAYVESMTPLDWFRVWKDRICMIDLGVRFGLASGGAVEVFEDDELVSEHAVEADGRVCVALPEKGDYSVMKLRTRRNGELRPPLDLHVKGGRLLGVIRK